MSDAPTLAQRRSKAAADLMLANAALAGIVNDAYAPVYCRQIIELAEMRLRELKTLYEENIFGSRRDWISGKDAAPA